MSSLYDPYSYRYHDSQLENERLRRQILDLKRQVQTLKWNNGDLKSDTVRESLKSAEESRRLHSKIVGLETSVIDLERDSYLFKKDASTKLKQLNEEVSFHQTHAQRLEWLNKELKREKANHARIAAEVELELLRKENEANTIRRSLDQERRRAETLERLNSSINSDYSRKSIELLDTKSRVRALEVESSRLESQVETKKLLLRASEDRISTLNRDRSKLLSENIEIRDDLNKTRSRLNDVESFNRTLNDSLRIERERATHLADESAELSMQNEDFGSRLKNHQQVYEDTVYEYERQLKQMTNFVENAKKNLNMFRSDASIVDHHVGKTESPKDLNRSDAFTSFHEKNIHQKEPQWNDDLERSIRLEATEKQLNRSIEKLKNWGRHH